MKRYILSALALAAMAGASAQAPANLVIEAKDGVKTVFDTSKIEGVLFSDMPSYKEADNLITSLYSVTGSFGQYVIELSTGKLDSKGNPEEVGGAKVSLTLLGPESQSSTSAELPLGYYTPGQDKNFTFAPSKSAMWVRNAEGDEGVSIAPIISGSVDVRQDGSAYEIRMELVSFAGDEVNLSYEGNINFTAHTTDYDPFDAPVDVTLTGLQGRFYGNWYYPFADDILVQGYTGEFDENDAQISGYWINLPLNMPKVSDPMNPVQKIADGVYHLDKRSNPKGNTYLPMTFQAGGRIETLGMFFDTGTYLTYKENGNIKIAYIADGTVTVSENGTNLVLDGRDQLGTPVKVSFKGAPNIVNFCDNEEKEIKHPWSTLAGNHELKFTNNTFALFFLDDPSIVEGLNTYTLWIVDQSMAKGDYLQFTVLTDRQGIPDGTYEVNETFKANTILHGWTGFSGTDMGGSWYADLDSSNAQGEQETIAPIYGGSLTVSTEGDVRKITFNLVDDNGNKITGSYTGAIIDGDQMMNQSKLKPRRLSLRK